MLSLFKCLRVSGFLKLFCNFHNAALLTDVKDRKLYSLYLFNVIQIINYPLSYFPFFNWAYQYFKHIRISITFFTAVSILKN